MNTSSKILDAIAKQLAEDGFAQPTAGIFVKKWDNSWCGWLGVDTGARLLSPIVGVFSEELIDIRETTLKKMGRSFDRRSDGPPLIMVSLDEISRGNGDSAKRITWEYAGSDLPLSVADDVVYCFRTNAYPYISAHTSYDAILEAVRAGKPSPAMPYYLPIILIKLGRLDDVSRYLADWKKIYTEPEIVAKYESYVNALLQYVEPDAE